MQLVMAERKAGARACIQTKCCLFAGSDGEEPGHEVMSMSADCQNDLMHGQMPAPHFSLLIYHPAIVLAALYLQPLGPIYWLPTFLSLCVPLPKMWAGQAHEHAYHTAFGPAACLFQFSRDVVIAHQHLGGGHSQLRPYL